jgi:hypothetical protein
VLLLLLPSEATAAAAAAAGQQSGTSKSEQQAAAAGSSNTTAAADKDGVQLRVLLREAVSSDDISSVSVNAAGTYLAAADDTGGYKRPGGGGLFLDCMY